MGKYQTPLVLICRQTDDDDVIRTSIVNDVHWSNDPWGNTDKSTIGQ